MRVSHCVGPIWWYFVSSWKNNIKIIHIFHNLVEDPLYYIWGSMLRTLETRGLCLHQEIGSEFFFFFSQKNQWKRLS